MEQVMFWFWLISAIVLAVVEALTPNLVTIWFAGGAVLATICAWFGFGYGVQLTVFVLVSVILLLLTRPLANKIAHRNSQPTNADRIIGQQAVVLQAISPLKKGRVRVSGLDWSAAADEEIPDGAVVEVLSIEGVTVKVKSINK